MNKSKEKQIVVDKTPFFSKIVIATANLKKYPKILTESVSNAFKYVLLVVLLMSMIYGLAELSSFVKLTNKFYSYVNNEMPEFSFIDNKLTASKTEAYDWDYHYRLIIDTESEVTADQIAEYKTKCKDDSISAVLLKDSLVLIIEGESNVTSYSKLFEGLDFNIENKASLIMLMKGYMGYQFNITCYIYFTILAFFNDIFIALFIVGVVNVVGLIADPILGLMLKRKKYSNKLNGRTIFKISFYSVTTSHILYTIYNILGCLTSIPYFGSIVLIYYGLIAVLYMLIVMCMIRYDFIKLDEEVDKLVKQNEEDMKELKEEVSDEEIETEEETKVEPEPEEKKDDIDEHDDPDGSEI